MESSFLKCQEYDYGARGVASSGAQTIPGMAPDWNFRVHITWKRMRLTRHSYVRYINLIFFRVTIITTVTDQNQSRLTVLRDQTCPLGGNQFGIHRRVGELCYLQRLKCLDHLHRLLHPRHHPTMNHPPYHPNCVSCPSFKTFLDHFNYYGTPSVRIPFGHKSA